MLLTTAREQEIPSTVVNKALGHTIHDISSTEKESKAQEQRTAVELTAEMPPGNGYTREDARDTGQSSRFVETTLKNVAIPVDEAAQGFGPLKTILSSVYTDFEVRFHFTA